MASKEEIKKRNEYIKNALITSDGVSKEALMLSLDIKERTVENIIKELKNAGWIIVNENGLYFLRNKTEIMNKQEEPESEKADVYQVLILFSLMDKNGRKLKLSEKELFRKVTGEGSLNNSEWFNTAISKLLVSGHIEFRDGKYFLGMNAPRLVVGIYDDYDDTLLIDLIRELGTQADSTEATLRIKKRLEWQYEGVASDGSQEKVYIKQGRHKNMDAVMSLIKDKLLTIPYMEKGLCLRYKSRNGEVDEYRIKVGMLLYSASLDCTYVLGEKIEDAKEIVCIRINGIEEISVIEDVENDVYNSEKYNDIYKKMYGVGYGNEEDVEIAFVDKPYIKSIVDKLYNERKKQGGSPTVSKDKDGRWIYCDTLIGVNNLLPFIRRMRTDNCEIIKPEHLREEMKKSARRILDRYGCTEV